MSIRRTIRRAFGRGRRPAGSVSPGPSPQAAPYRVPGGWVELNGTRFALTERVADFMAIVPTERRIVLRMRTLDYEGLYHRDLHEAFGARYAAESPEHKAFYHAQLCCTGCGWEFPGSYTMSLIGMLDTYRISGGTPGYADFGRTGRCSRCGSDTSFLVYECFHPQDISEDDVAALRHHWWASAQRWWSTAGRHTGICDICSIHEVTPNNSYLESGSHVICAGCVEKRLADALVKLRDNPYLFGKSELRRARSSRHA